ncbi:TolC family protein [Salegentibacter salegens]|uniref:Outer membrane protein TolC n=1 Tax=Salegentibacter salegens TaxID=143223 RepID=A0A1M7L752_9FLAO|nr:TolC family protein [Salegentibacter salegens]PRX42202.1 outer membrane protein TolC [Salegentibacter salegens]SHM73744.1 Outer membrane protein TolC [Salegentibacter salegens]
MIAIKLPLYITVFLFGLVLQAQEVRIIAKEEVISKVKENNQKLKISEQEFFEARADYRQTNAVFLPNIKLSHTGFTTNNPLMAFGSKLNQEIISQSDFNPDLLNNPNKIENFATKLEVQQPLINMDGIYQRKAAKSKMEASEFQTLRTEEYMILEVEKAYMLLQLAHKAIAVLEKAKEATLANKKLADDRLKQGYLQRYDVLVVEVRVTEVDNQLQYAKSNVKNASDYLAFLMNEPQGVIMQPLDSLQLESLPEASTLKVLAERADIKAMEMATEARKKIHQSDKMAFLPRLNAFGSYELYDDELFTGDANGYLVGMALSWDILQGTKRFGKANKSKAEYEKAKLEYEQYVSKSQLELNKAKRALTDAENKLRLTSLALEQSKESLRILTNRFGQGLEKTTDLLMAETQYSEKELEYFQTIYEYNYALAYFEFLSAG